MSEIPKAGVVLLFLCHTGVLAGELSEKWKFASEMVAVVAEEVECSMSVAVAKNRHFDGQDYLLVYLDLAGSECVAALELLNKRGRTPAFAFFSVETYRKTTVSARTTPARPLEPTRRELIHEVIDVAPNHALEPDGDR